MSRMIIAWTLASIAFAAPAGGDDSMYDGARSAAHMTAAARAFVGTLDAAQKKISVFGLETDERATWSNLPISMVRPSGILVGDLDDGQRAALHDLLRASMSSQGYAKITGIMRLDDLLFGIESAELDAAPDDDNTRRRREFVRTRSSGNYAVAVFGEPGNGDWGWKIAGHHAAANFTVAGDRVGFTPTFVGSNPLTVASGPYAGWTVLPHEGARGIELMESLTGPQRAAALLGDEVPDDIFEGPGRRASLGRFEGLKTDELSVRQMQLLRALVSEYVGNSEFDAAAAQLALVDAAGWENLWFSWRGPIEIDGEFYYRVHGPRLLIEYNRQNPNHDHSVIRDPANDYGEDWLEHHYQEHHPTL